MDVVSVPDLCDRWLYTKQGVHRLTKGRSFPVPLFVVSRGRVPVWYLPDIETWEKDHPEVYDEGAKLRKQKGYFRARLKGVGNPNSQTETQP
jgi:hypothetical protein